MENKQILKECPVCRNEFLARNWKHRPGTFCSQTCQRKGRARKPLQVITNECQFCEKEFTQPKHWKSPGKFCSIQCMSKARGENMRGEKHPNWKGGDDRTGSHLICKKIKEEVGRCQKCNSTSDLQVHHKIKVSERPDLASSPENIQILCVQCHAKEHPEFAGMLLKKKSGEYLQCIICKKQYYVPKYRLGTSKYCSNPCRLKGTWEVRRKNAVTER